MTAELLTAEAELATDDAQALRRLRSALHTAEEQGAVTVRRASRGGIASALCAAAIRTRSRGRACVRSTAARLSASGQDWTLRALQALKQALPTAGSV